jgi:hypothetical protein
MIGVNSAISCPWKEMGGNLCPSTRRYNHLNPVLPLINSRVKTAKYSFRAQKENTT